MIRSVFIRFLHIYDREVRQLNITDELIAKGFTVGSLKNQKVKVGFEVNNFSAQVVLRKNTSDLLVFNQVILRKEYELLHEFVKNYYAIEKINVIVDVGANIGLTSLYFHCFFPKASIHAIEPDKGNFLMLKENISVNNLGILAMQKALLASRGWVVVTNAFRDRQAWSTQVIESGSSGDIEALSLADVRRKNGIKNIDILKVDIEGHEADLFRSNEFLSELKAIKFIALEVHEEKADRIAIINILQRAGFRLVYKGETLFGVNEAYL